jgi:hypothetical protein
MGNLQSEEVMLTSQRKIVTPKEYWAQKENNSHNQERRIYLFDAFGTLFSTPTYSDKQKDKLREKDFIIRALTKPLGIRDSNLFQSASESVQSNDGIILLNNITGPRYIVSDLASPFAKPVLNATTRYQGHFFSFEMGMTKSKEFYQKVLDELEIKNGKRAQIILISDHDKRDIAYAKQAGIEQAIWIHEHGNAPNLRKAYDVIFEDTEMIRHLGIKMTNKIYNRLGINAAQEWFTEQEFNPHQTPKRMCEKGHNNLVIDYIQGLE